MALARVSAPTGERAPSAWRSAVGLSLSVALLAGCQSNPEPPPLESTSTSTSPSPSPTQAAPTLPPEAKGTSKAAAKAFVRHYVDTVNYAMSTGDTEPLGKLSSENCSTCEAILHKIEVIYSNGGHLENTGWKIRSIAFVAGGQGDSALISAGLDLPAERAYMSADSAPKRSRKSRGNLDFWLTGRGSDWHIANLEATQ